MMVGELDFDRNDTVIVQRQDGKGRWINIGHLDIAASTIDFIALDSWMEAGRGALIGDGNRLRFQSRYENTSRERREEATSRILRGDAAAPGLFDVFCPSKRHRPRRLAHPINEEAIAKRYGLNTVQVASFKNMIECRPVGLLQGPPGTGKTRFIGALVHYALTHGLARNVLLASQSHEAVNSAGEAVLELFGDERDSLSLIRVGHEGSVSETLKPYHAARVERAYKDHWLATARLRLAAVATSLGLNQELSDRVLQFEDEVQPVLTRILDAAQDDAPNIATLNALKATVEQQLSALGIEIRLDESEPSTLDADVLGAFLSSLPDAQAAAIERFRHVIQLSRDIVGSVSTWQRSFETFLAGTRQVVAGTCVGLGRTSLGLTKTVFDLVIVDEAARCTPSELAVPIQAGKWVVLVGDHAQLEPLHPPEVIEVLADELSIPLREIARSDFERTFESDYGRAGGATLTKQYRMLPPIGRVVSSAFYDRALQHGRHEPILPIGAMTADFERPLIWVSTDSFGAGAHQKPDKFRRGSLTNHIEADVIVALLKRWAAHEPFLSWLGTRTDATYAIGIICAYSAQRDFIWRKLQAENLPDITRKSLKVDTIDSYQGKENPIVLLSLVRNNSDGPIYSGIRTIKPGFMARSNRVNVAVSRAMDRLIIVGARGGWRAGSPLARVADAIAEEIKGGEALLVDGHELLEAAMSTDKRKKGALHGLGQPAERASE
jgi:hypothetical protein